MSSPIFKNYLQADNTIDVMQIGWPTDEYELFFGPLLPKAQAFPTNTKNIGEILFQLGLAQSNTWCRKNNWWRDLQPGYQEIVFGSKRIKLCLLIL